MKIIRLIDRTRTVTDWRCPRARYWGYEYLGRGIVKSSTSLPLFTGITIHDSLAAIATIQKDGQEVPIDEIATLAFKQMYDQLVAIGGDKPTPEQVEFAKEQATLTEGMIRGFYKHVWPRLMAKWPTIVAIEKEVEYTLDKCPTCQGSGMVAFQTHAGGPEGEMCPDCDEHGNYVFMAKPDLLLEGPDGELAYIEYKSTKSKKEEWINSWDTAVQLHSSLLAVEQTMGRRPDLVQIVGLYKGYESYGKQSSPFCYAYKKLGNPPFTQDVVQYEYKAGLRRYATWELEGGLKTWIAGMPDSILANQFPMTPPIYINEDLVNKFFSQRLVREREIESGVLGVDLLETEENMLNRVFPQKFDQCVPSYGWSCEYKKLCHSFVQDPLQEGFELRTPHHERELDGLNG